MRMKDKKEETVLHSYLTHLKKEKAEKDSA